MNEMLERIARAIKERTLEDDNDALCGLTMDDAIRCTIAAIETMRKPTQAMIDAGNDTFHPPDYASAEECYQAMIASIAKEGSPS